jgi:hypothetical protein
MKTRSWHAVAIIVAALGIAACFDSQPLAPTSRNEVVMATPSSPADSAVFWTGRKEKPQGEPVDTSASIAEVILDVPTQDLTVGQSVQLSVTLKDAQGKTLIGRLITYSSDNPSIVNVSASGVISAVGTGFTRVRVSSGGVSAGEGFNVRASANPSDPAPPAPPTPPPSSDAVGVILAILGQTKTVEATAALGDAFATYDRLFDRYLPSSNTWEDDYYDRGVVYYARYARTGDITYLTKAHQIVLEYRQRYLEPNNYHVPPNWSLVRGLEIHYRLTGDDLSRRAVAGMFAWGLSPFSDTDGGNPADLQNENSSYMENRIQARVLQGALSAFRLNASFTRSDGITFSEAEWPARLREMLNQILSVQKADGSFSWVQICGGQLNYMVGMLNDVLIEYYRDFEPDPRIPVAVEKANEYLWTTQWIAAEQGFKYASVNCTPNQFGTNVGGMDAAGDLNGLLIASFGWLYQRTGDEKWKTRGDAIMSGLVLQRWAGAYASSKQFNQAFAESYRYLGWR